MGVSGALDIRQTVILAAGSGSRLSLARGAVPKPLTRIGRKALIEYALGQAVDAGCREAIVVTGDGADQVRAHLEALELRLRVTLVHNDRFHEPNGVSLLAASPYVTGPFFLQMADHVFGQPVLGRLAERGAAAPECLRLLVDFQPEGIDLEDATKVRVSGGQITTIGKEVWTYDGVDTGCFLLDPRVFEALRRVRRFEPPSVTLGMRQLIAGKELAAVPLTGVKWIDVDTPDDHARAEQMLRAEERSGREAAVR
jgi:choline kinase